LAIEAVAQEVGIKSTQEIIIDYHYYNRILFDLHAVANNPNDRKAKHHLSQLANVASGHPQIGKQIAGALLMIAGLLLIAASIALLVTTFGGSAPASAVGIGLGLKVTFAAGAALTATAAIGSTFFGVQKYKEGQQRQGLSQTLDTVFRHN
jgi:hypothetical protein